MYSPEKAKLEPEQLPPEMRRFSTGLKFFAECVLQIRAFAEDISRGNLGGALPARNNEMAASLKSLHAALTHLTWQTQQIAKGDYKQKVSFMGDFSGAFNDMVGQLEARTNALLASIERERQKSMLLERNNEMLIELTSNIEQQITVVDMTSTLCLYHNRANPDIYDGECFGDAAYAWVCGQLASMSVHTVPYSADVELVVGDRQKYYSVSCSPVHWGGKSAGVFLWFDITREREQMNRLKGLAYLDKLTKVANRHAGMEILTLWLREKKAFALCFIDIDNLKYVNDEFGHAAGDAYILEATAALLGFSDDAFVSRIGGDEFMVLAPRRTVAATEDRLEQIHGILGAKRAAPNAKYPYSISYGVIAVTEDEHREISKLLSEADEKMYTHKRLQKKERAPTS
jgi:diguanylate cyclase (GGDEF)-like protein